jgi:hypothetical protein
MTLSVSGDSITFPDLSTLQTAPSGFGFKNRIINGDMRIDQRNAGASVTQTTTTTYTLDRLAAQGTVASKYTVQQNAGSVTPPVGFTKYLGVTSLSAYAIGAGDAFTVQQSIEGFNVADLAWGTASAAQITLSFLIRSSLTGTFGGALRNGGLNRSYPFTYTVSVANTWTQISVTISGDTTGTWATDNSTGINLVFGLGVGSTFSGTAGTWAATNYNSATGATSVVGTSGATFYVTGVQLEKGSTATAFDYRDYGRELSMCQRYYQTSGVGIGQVNSAAGSSVFLPFFCPMRAAPSVSIVDGTNTFLDSAVAQRNITSVNSITSGIGNTLLGAKMDISHASTTTGKTALTHAGAFAFSAEL